MENNFVQKENTKENVNLLLDQNFTQRRSAIYNKKSTTCILVNMYAKTFWVTCQEGKKDASEVIKEMFNQKITIQCQIKYQHKPI